MYIIKHDLDSCKECLVENCLNVWIYKKKSYVIVTFTICRSLETWS